MTRAGAQRQHRSRGWLVVAVAAAAIVAAGCGGDPTPEDATPGTIASAGTDDGASTDGDGSDDGDPEGPTSSVETDTDDGGSASDEPEDGDAETADADGENEDADENEDPDADAGTESSDADADAGDESSDEAPERTGPLLNQVGPDDSGDDVVALQERLAELGFALGPADGDYGRRTRMAVQVFQELNELPTTGRADRRTVEALATFRYDGLLLVAGDEGADVEALQNRLAEGPFDPGPVDGVYGGSTVAAVWALEKLANVPVDGDWGPVDELAWQRLMAGQVGQPERDHDQRWVEVDLSQQLMKVYDPGSTTPVLISHASSGSGIPWENEEHRGSSVTPLGDFHINRRISGWRESSLNIGRLYNPLYFNGGIAFHGATSVPLYPASHGCIRLPMHVADYLPGELPNGTPVHILA